MGDLHITGRISESGKFLALHPLFDKAFEFLKRSDLTDLAPGRHEIDGDRCWANVQEVELKPLSERKLEAHRRYIDIQAPITGSECIGFADMDEKALALPFNVVDDYVLYEGESRPVTLQPGEFAIFFPDAAHAPCAVAPDGPPRIKKVVVKVLAEN